MLQQIIYSLWWFSRVLILTEKSLIISVRCFLDTIRTIQFRLYFRPDRFSMCVSRVSYVRDLDNLYRRPLTIVRVCVCKRAINLFNLNSIQLMESLVFFNCTIENMLKLRGFSTMPLHWLRLVLHGLKEATLYYFDETSYKNGPSQSGNELVHKQPLIDAAPSANEASNFCQTQPKYEAASNGRLRLLYLRLVVGKPVLAAIRRQPYSAVEIFFGLSYIWCL